MLFRLLVFSVHYQGSQTILIIIIIIIIIHHHQRICPLGQGGVSPSDVADAMVDAVVDFVRKKQTRFVHSVKILIFQPVMMSLFHKSMMKREGQEVKEKSTFTMLKGIHYTALEVRFVSCDLDCSVFFLLPSCLDGNKMLVCLSILSDFLSVALSSKPIG